MIQQQKYGSPLAQTPGRIMKAGGVRPLLPATAPDASYPQPQPAGHRMVVTTISNL